MKPSAQPMTFLMPRSEKGHQLIEHVTPSVRLGDMVLDISIASRLERLVAEQRAAERIKSSGLEPRRKLLLSGPPGCGKTMTAAAIAGTLKLPLFRTRSDGIIASYMGDTGKNLRTVFEQIEKVHGVYLFDEFDSIGASRAKGHDVKEMDRAVNSLLQMMENDASSAILIAATNLLENIDAAMFRRFDDVIQFALPAGNEIKDLMLQRLGNAAKNIDQWPQLIEAATGLCHADIGRACAESRKRAIVDERPFDAADLLAALAEVQSWRPATANDGASAAKAPAPVPKRTAKKQAAKNAAATLFEGNA